MNKSARQIPIVCAETIDEMKSAKVQRTVEDFLTGFEKRFMGEMRALRGQCNRLEEQNNYLRVQLNQLIVDPPTQEQRQAKMLNYVSRCGGGDNAA